jgi:hypothetical protein
MLRLLTRSWLKKEGNIAQLDPSIDEHLLKTTKWNKLAITSIHRDLAKCIHIYSKHFKSLFEACPGVAGGMCFSRDWRIFWLTSDRKLKATIRQVQEEYIDMEGQGEMSQGAALELLAGALKDVSPVNDHFMHDALKAVFVDFTGVFEDINQLYFRHLMAWMNYELWHKQPQRDFCGRRNRYLHLSYEQMRLQAAADANNSPDEWANTYAPEGMSRFTHAQELAQAGDQVGLGSETETDEGDE